MSSNASNSSHREPDALDGSRWLVLDEGSKYAYAVGFLEGMFLGHCFTTWELPDGPDEAFRHASKSYERYWKHLVADVTYRQFVEGLDRLYSDELNRRIAIKDGMWIVMNQESGLRDEKMMVMIEAFREKAEEPNDISAATYFKGPTLVN